MTTTDSSTFPSAAQLVDRVPLIKNPAFWVPPPVQVPPDIHPLPDDVQAYFVYPHTLESHVLSTLPATLSTLEQTHAQRVALLASYAESKERARKAKLQAIAPGWNEGGEIMQPVRKETTTTTTTTTTMPRPIVSNPSTESRSTARGDTSAGDGGDPATPRADRPSFLGGPETGSPGEMGQATMDQMQRDQMQDWLDKWDGGSTQGHSSGAGEGQLI
ncbi:hypothetical protein JCM10212_002998 [Sporobolomyces blumeae]